jgi:hypothetical protein
MVGGVESKELGRSGNLWQAIVLRKRLLESEEHKVEESPLVALALATVELLRGEWHVGSGRLGIENPGMMTVLAGNPFQGNFDCWRTYIHWHRWKPLRAGRGKTIKSAKEVHVLKGS